MNLNTNDELTKKIKNCFFALDSIDDLEHNTKMIMYRFLSEIERLAEEKGLNRKELSSLIGTSASYITQLFRGNKLINLETIAKFQKVFDITFEIKAIPNNVDEAFIGINVDNICENQNNIQGFWAFHKFKPMYNDEPNNNLNISNNFELRTA